MKKFLTRVAVILMLLVMVVVPVSAHEGREVGDYVLTFGWRSEPALAGLLNGPELSISLHDADHDAAFPEDIEVSLQAEVSFGDQTTTVLLRQEWGTTGHYIAELIPALPGDYSFHITGTIGDTPVDEVFSSADGGFSSVEPLSDIVFPAIEPADASAQIAAFEARIAELETRLAALEGS